MLCYLVTFFYNAVGKKKKEEEEQKNLANEWYKNNKYLFLVNIVAV